MKLLIGGSPCTHWSIAQTKNREVTAEGIGWELFLNYRIARDKYRPDYFLYENNKSMSSAIREQITAELGVEPILINSALVSAQNRQRLYWVGKRNPDGTYSRVRVEQPEDRGILLRDILESGICWKENGYTLKANYHKASAANYFDGGHFPAAAAAEPVAPSCVAQRGRYIGEGGSVAQHFEVRKDGKTNTLTTVQKDNLTAVPVRIGTVENDAKNRMFDSRPYRCYSPDAKSVTLCCNGGGGGAKTGLYAVPIPTPVNETVEGKAQCLRATYYKDGIRNLVGNHVDRKTCVATPIKPGEINGGGQGIPVPAVDAGTNQTVSRSIEDLVEKKGYLPERFNPYNRAEITDKSPTLSTGSMVTSSCATLVVELADGKRCPVYEVRDGLIAIKDKQYPIKLADGFYIIRRLTVAECKRLQTVPDAYTFPVSDTQAYKMLGNGWTVDVIAHIMSHFLGLTKEPVEVLSMYDGMSCGHIALNKLGAKISTYYATEIDKYAIQTTQHNFPDTVQLGDAFRVRDTMWSVRKEAEHEPTAGEADGAGSDPAAGVRQTEGNGTQG